MKKLTALAALLVISSSVSWGQTNEQRNAYNIRRGLESYDAQNYKDAVGFFYKETVDNPSNPLGYYFVADIMSNHEKVGLAIQFYGLALQHLAPKDEYYSMALCGRSAMYDVIDADKAALADYSVAVKSCKDAYALIHRALYYGRKNRLNDAIADLEAAKKKVNDSQSLEYINNCIAIFYARLGEHDKALGIFNSLLGNPQVESYIPSYILSRGRVLYALGKYDEAMDDFVDAYSKGNYEGRDYMVDSVPLDVALPKLLKAAAGQSPVSAYFHLIAADALYSNNKFAEARKEYRIHYAACDDHPDSKYGAIANTYYAQFALSKAEEVYLQQEKLSSSTRSGLYYIYYSMGETDKAAAQLDSLIEEEPDNCWPYAEKASLLWRSGCPDKALIRNLCDVSLLLFDNYISPLITKSLLCLQEGDTAEAVALARKVVDIASTEDLKQNDAVLTAYCVLGQPDKAMDYLNNWEQSLKVNVFDVGVYRARLIANSMLGRGAAALASMRKLLENGYYDFHFFKTNPILDNLRKEQGFDAMVSEFYPLYEMSLSNID